MTNSKLQAALDEVERLRDTVRGFIERNGALPHSDSDAGRALLSLEIFTNELHKLEIGGLLRPGKGLKRQSLWSSILPPVLLKFVHQSLRDLVPATPLGRRLERRSSCMMGTAVHQS